jgi:iron complex transport system ATP-binding protein
MSGSPVLEVDGLTVFRGGERVLDDVSWSVRPGEHWVLFGGNGSGKTTLLSALLTYVPAARGTISVLGKEHGRFDWRTLRKWVGMVSNAVERLIPSEERAIDLVRGGKEGMIGSWGAGSSHDEALARAELRALDCEYLATRRFDVLSQGERQRVLIARALMARPALLILDEPCSGLDAAARERFLLTLERLAARPDAPSQLLVTHHVEEISGTFGHLLMLRAGKVVARGTTADTLTSDNVSRALGTPMIVRQHAGRYSLSLSHEVGEVV